MFKLTTTKGIYKLLESIAPADIWEWAEARCKQWKVQVRWSFDPSAEDYGALRAFAGLLSAASMQPKLTNKRRVAITKLYNDVRVECCIAHRLRLLVQEGATNVLDTPQHKPEPTETEEVSADLSDAAFFGLETGPATEAEAAEAQEVMAGEFVASLEAQGSSESAPEPVEAQGPTESFAALQAAPKEPQAPCYEAPPSKRRAQYLLAALFNQIENGGA